MQEHAEGGCVLHTGRALWNVGLLLPRVTDTPEAGRGAWSRAFLALQREGIPVDTLLSDFQPPQPWDSKFLLFQPHILGYLLMAVLGNKYSPSYSLHIKLFLLPSLPVTKMKGFQIKGVFFRGPVGRRVPCPPPGHCAICDSGRLLSEPSQPSHSCCLVRMCQSHGEQSHVETLPLWPGCVFMVRISLCLHWMRIILCPITWQKKTLVWCQ